MDGTMTIASAAITLFLLMDPIGNTPVFLSTLSRLTRGQRRRATFRELVFALIILMTFLFFGQVIMGALNITAPALSIAGGVVLFLVALRMIFPGRHGSMTDEETNGDPWLVPLAVPLVAGPSAMAFVILLASRDPDRMGDWALAIGIAWVVSAIILIAADLLRPLLKDPGLRALERLMGMILTVISVQMLMDGIGQFLGSLR